ncbi:MAG: PEP/pyruvate-binding domain-containing protein [Anaerolineales bacterium]|nr:PEP/pyruvate-binding domain-containing protein [Anaerolineales bacterium]
MTPTPETSKVLNIFLLIAQYPIMASPIRRRMREELFRRGIISQERFEDEIREKAVESQLREGITPKNEDPDQWNLRFHRVRRTLTDFYFAYNLPIELLEGIVKEVLEKHTDSTVVADLQRRFNPELAPLSMVLNQAESFENLPEKQRTEVVHHLQELRVVMLKSLVSDQLAFINVAKQWFTTADFNYILKNRIGTGKVGGKAAGLLLAYKILQNNAPEIFEQVVVPRSFFVGADIFYQFLANNELDFIGQKYKTVEQIRAEFSHIQDQFTRARFPDEIADRLREILNEVGRMPLIVRSSSLLEDNFGTSFAGKYASFFCPNQGTPSENLRDLTLAIRCTYASVFSPDALMYRRRMGLLDYDERMAILLQEVQGERLGSYYLPTMAGVAYSYSPIVWNPRIHREDGFVRLVMGLGTRAVDRVGTDYPRLVNLSHPQLRPEVTPKAIRYYSQHYVDLLNLEKNKKITLPVEDVLDDRFPGLRWIASVDDGDTISPPLTVGRHLDPKNLVLTFDSLLQHSQFVPLLKTILSRLSDEYRMPVDVEFVVSLKQAGSSPELVFHLLQCRPQNRWQSEGASLPVVPTDLSEKHLLFSCSKMVPQGYVDQIDYIVFVDPEKYHQLESAQDYTEVARQVGKLNKALEEHSFILIGPGRWGSTDFKQGVSVTYADIFNARALIELISTQQGYSTEPSYGTHFFQDLVETQIYPLAIHPEEDEDTINLDFIREAQDRATDFLKDETRARKCIKVIFIPGETAGAKLEIAMDGQCGMGYFVEQS